RGTAVAPADGPAGDGVRSAIDAGEAQRVDRAFVNRGRAADAQGGRNGDRVVGAGRGADRVGCGDREGDGPARRRGARDVQAADAARRNVQARDGVLHVADAERDRAGAAAGRATGPDDRVNHHQHRVAGGRVEGRALRHVEFDVIDTRYRRAV